MDSAQDLISRPTPADDDLERQFRTTVDEARAVGLTSLHDAGFNPESLAFFGRCVVCVLERGCWMVEPFGALFSHIGK